MRRVAEVSEMRRSYLVQRLNKPLGGSFLGMKDNPFSFGGGYANGGLSGDAMDLLRGIWSFDYMGAAEFEWGAVPEALSLVAGLAAKKGGLSTAVLPVDLSTVDMGRPSPQKAEGVAYIYVLAPSEHMAEVQERILGWTKKAYGVGLMESLNLVDTLVPTREWHGRTVGWLELDNGFLFFTDEAMFTATCDLFGVTR